MSVYYCVTKALNPLCGPLPLKTCQPKALQAGAFAPFKNIIPVKMVGCPL